jgi:hypothetical protein
MLDAFYRSLIQNRPPVITHYGDRRGNTHKLLVEMLGQTHQFLVTTQSSDVAMLNALFRG